MRIKIVSLIMFVVFLLSACLEGYVPVTAQSPVDDANTAVSQVETELAPKATEQTSEESPAIIVGIMDVQPGTMKAQFNDNIIVYATNGCSVLEWLIQNKIEDLEAKDKRYSLSLAFNVDMFGGEKCALEMQAMYLTANIIAFHEREFDTSALDNAGISIYSRTDALERLPALLGLQ